MNAEPVFDLALGACARMVHQDTIQLTGASRYSVDKKNECQPKTQIICYVQRHTRSPRISVAFLRPRLPKIYPAFTGRRARVDANSIRRRADWVFLFATSPAPPVE
jgi:hypothetical protein